MLPCHACHRHVRAVESSCPFCGARLARGVSPLRELVGVVGAIGVGASLLGAVGCTSEIPEDPQAGTTTSPSSTQEGTDSASTTEGTEATESSESEVTSSTLTDTDDSTDPQTNTSGGFYAGPDVDLPAVSECDSFAQDCPEGEKCVPSFGFDYGTCVPVMGEGAAGDPCSSEGETDDCDADNYCWNDSNEGSYCMPFCQGSPDQPLCPDETTCLSASGLNVCLNDCDPLLQDCAEEEACHWLEVGFMCIYTLPTPQGEPCGYLNDCEPGATCALAESLPSCEAVSCCVDYCDLQDPEACPDPELECQPFVPPNEEPLPEGYEQLGVCVVPLP